MISINIIMVIMIIMIIMIIMFIIMILILIIKIIVIIMIIFIVCNIDLDVFVDDVEEIVDSHFDLTQKEVLVRRHNLQLIQLPLPLTRLPLQIL